MADCAWQTRGLDQLVARMINLRLESTLELTLCFEPEVDVSARLVTGTEIELASAERKSTLA